MTNKYAIPVSCDFLTKKYCNICLQTEKYSFFLDYHWCEIGLFSVRKKMRKHQYCICYMTEILL